MMWFVSRRRFEEELAAAKAETARQRRRADKAEDRIVTAEFNRGQVLGQLADADAANRRLEGRVLELGRRLARLTESDPEYAARLERRVARLRRVGKRVLAAYAAERKRADHLQTRYDDAVGRPSDGIADSGRWQPGYQQPKAEVVS